MSIIDQVDLTPKQWAMVIAGGVGIGLLLRKRAASSSSSSAETDAIAEDAPLTYQGQAAGAGYVSSVWGNSNPSTGTASAGADGTGTVPDPATTTTTTMLPDGTIVTTAPYTPPPVAAPTNPYAPASTAPSTPVAPPDVLQPAVDYTGRAAAFTGGVNRMARPLGYSDTYLIGPSGISKITDPAQAQELIRQGVVAGDPARWTDGILKLSVGQWRSITGIDPASAGFAPMPE